jgi:hypothetical protein
VPWTASDKGGVFDSRLEARQQSGHETCFAAEAHEECEVDVDGFARLTPSLDCDAADETQPPPCGFAELLQIGWGPDNAVQIRGIL